MQKSRDFFFAAGLYQNTTNSLHNLFDYIYNTFRYTIHLYLVDIQTILSSYKKILFALVTLLIASAAHATHYRAGEITYKRLVGNTYEITVITYTDPRSDANPNTISINLNWGDGKSELVMRSQVQVINQKVQRNTYIAIHQYQTASGTFRVSVTDPNRVDRILNINRGFSREIAFYIESVITINSSIGSNQSPVLLSLPIDDGCLNALYTHNPGAYDSDGDSLAYFLVPPKQGGGGDVPLYVDPFNTDSFSINPVTGTVFWAKPNQTGTYNIAILIVEYRNGIVVGNVLRDMQIEIFDCPNSPPFIQTMNNDCIKAGDNFTRTISASDINSSQVITLIPIGGPFVQSNSPATLTPNPATGTTNVNAQFNWRPICTNIRSQAYFMMFKASDNYGVPATYSDGFFLKVNAPEPENVLIAQEGRDAFRISWDLDSCRLATKYFIFRRIDSSGWMPDRCETGIAAEAGFKQIGVLNLIQSPGANSFLDNDNGKGLSPMVNYCYRIVALYPARDGSGLVHGGRVDYSYASAEVCENIIRSKPVITQTSVLKTSSTNGIIRIEYLRPDTLDTVIYKAPYQLIFSKKNNAESAFLSFSQYTFNSFESIKDSFLLDSGINTLDSQWTYQIGFYSNTNTTSTFVDNSPTASSIYAVAYATDKANILTFQVTVPWQNDTFVIYRKNALNLFDSIGYSTSNTFTDNGLENGVNYCYLTKSIGKYSLLPLKIENLSQEICAIPIDTISPCPPPLVVAPPCDGFAEFSNKLSWTKDSSDCNKDILQYYLFFKSSPDSNFVKIDSVPFGMNHYEDNRPFLKKSIAGCYAITAVDSNGNESRIASQFCVDNCPVYVLPNVFTPNKDPDNFNDLLQPFPYRFIDKISLKIYNRWGSLVFKTENLDIQWDGTDQITHAKLPPGVYYYTCDVHERFLKELKVRKMNGTITILK